MKGAQVAWKADGLCSFGLSRCFPALHKNPFMHFKMLIRLHEQLPSYSLCHLLDSFVISRLFCGCCIIHVQATYLGMILEHVALANISIREGTSPGLGEGLNTVPRAVP